MSIRYRDMGIVRVIVGPKIPTDASALTDARGNPPVVALW